MILVKVFLVKMMDLDDAVIILYIKALTERRRCTYYSHFDCWKKNGER